MAEEKKVVEFEQLTLEQQEDVRKELVEAATKWRDFEINLTGIEIMISENVSLIVGAEEDFRKENVRIGGVQNTLRGERAERRKMPMGAERATKARAYLDSVKALTENILNQAKASGALNEAKSNHEKANAEYDIQADELDRLESKLIELQRRARMV